MLRGQGKPNAIVGPTLPVLRRQHEDQLFSAEQALTIQICPTCGEMGFVRSNFHAPARSVIKGPPRLMAISLEIVISGGALPVLINTDGKIKINMGKICQIVCIPDTINKPTLIICEEIQ